MSEQNTSSDTPAGEGAPKTGLNKKRVSKKLGRIASIEKPKKFERKRHALAYELLQQIADGTIKRPKLAAQSFIENYPEAPQASAESK
ncbi:hypothetical protein [Pseudooceanicola nanhaiensis]|uniref:hypothetical protein n=1 Tax=Pseudooceanicola nanhaiensis TaxID=375761 RepID=UPI001CD1A4F2|nr:hypothetical protein [Pseudooceanicola nanhaiensis]MCA0922777.1 hypothetical protein [Pseudooceanicola nanhaiensis]